MLDSDGDHSSDINIWISFADVFAGLMLTSLVGLAVVLSARNEENIKFSHDLVLTMNQATEITKGIKFKLMAQSPQVAARMKSSETQIEIPAGALFSSSGYKDYENDAAKRQVLTTIRKALQETLDESGNQRGGLRIIIEGHTDSDPITSGSDAIPTNWELSSRRATGVLRFFEDGGLDAKKYNIVAMGLADTQPVAPNTKDEKWQNRRIVIRIAPDFDKVRDNLKSENLQ